MNRILVYFMILFLSIKWIFKITIGDTIFYKGKKFQVINGVCPSTWKVIEKLYNKSSEIPRSECKKIWSLKGIIRSFKSGYSFYMGYWYDIWVNVGIETWMKGCHIWGN